MLLRLNEKLQRNANEMEKCVYLPFHTFVFATSVFLTSGLPNLMQKGGDM